MPTDPLSLVFLGCALVAGLILLASVALGGGHGAHTGHVGHVGHAAHAGHVSPAGHVAGHVAGHIGLAEPASHSAGGNAAPRQGPADGAQHAGGDAWAGARSLLLGSLNVNGALIFLLVFGLLGYLLRSAQGVSLLMLVIVAALMGTLAAIVVNALLARIFIASQAGELSADSSRLEGRLATVSLPIRAGGIGEVIFTGPTGARQSLGARSATGRPIEVGEEVVIVGAEDGLVTAQPWSAFLDESRGATRAGGPTLPAAPTASTAPTEESTTAPEAPATHEAHSETR